MIPDPTAEIKRIRHQLGAEDGFDLNRIFARIQHIQEQSGRKCIRLPARKPSDNNVMHRSGEATRSEVENKSSPSGER